jgi:4-amino-4-deoxy-L-arabinose transferase-like glycosyltransferase
MPDMLTTTADPAAAGATTRQPGPPGRWTWRRGLAVCLIVSGVLRLVAVGSIPLVITNDGVSYITWATQLFRHQPFTIAPYRTPGYPLLLTGIWEVFGLGPAGVLVTQHLMGLAVTALVFFIALRLSNAVAATVVALMYSFDPWVLGLSSYALSEALTMFVVVAAAALAWHDSRKRLWWSLVLGGLLGFACLVRPSCQILIPFFLLARAVRLGARGWTHGAAALAAGAVGAALVLLPWLQFNARRGIHELATGSGTLLFMNVKLAGLLQADLPVPDDIRRAYERHLRPVTWSEADMFLFLDEVDGFNRSSKELGAWAKASIKAAPGKYAAKLPASLSWLLRLFPDCFGREFDDMKEFLARAAASGSNIQYTGSPPGLELFTSSGSRGMMRRFLNSRAKHAWPGFPAMPLFAVVVLAGGRAWARRDWATLLVYAGTLGFLFAHVALLCVSARYSLPLWPIWYAAVADVVTGAARRFRRADAGV